MKRLCVLLLLISFTSRATSLVEAYHLALKNNPDYQISDLNRQKTQLGIGESRSALLPSLGASTGLSYNQSDDSSSNAKNSYNYGLNFKQKIIDVSAWRTLDASKLEYQHSEIEQQHKQQKLRSDVIELYLDVASAKAALLISQQDLEQAQSLLEVTQDSYRAGRNTISDVEQAQSRITESRIKLIRSQSDLKIKHANLAQLIGQDASDIHELGDKTDEQREQRPLNLWLFQGQNHSPLLQSARLNISLAEKKREAAQAGYYPTLDGSANYGGGDALGHSSAGRAGASLSLSIPLDITGKTRNVVQQAGLALTIKKQELIQQQLDLQNQITRSFLEQQSQYQQIKLLREQIQLNKSLLKHQISNYLAGKAKADELLKAHDLLFTARQNLLQARYHYWIERSTLQQLAGILNDTALMKLSGMLN